MLLVLITFAKTKKQTLSPTRASDSWPQANQKQIGQTLGHLPDPALTGAKTWRVRFFFFF